MRLQLPMAAPPRGAIAGVVVFALSATARSQGQGQASSNGGGSGSGSISTVSAYLPGYNHFDWEALRGSIVGQDESVTTYTIFCEDQAPTCQIAGDLPFIFAEGPHTLSYGGSAAGVLTADLQCALAGKTAATCTGSSSFGPNYHQGTISGPTQTVWTKTLSGSDVSWGVLTLATPGPLPGTTNIDGTAAAAGGSSQTGGFVLMPTANSLAVQREGGRGGMVGVLVGAVVVMGGLI